jgi:hypothetical protein
MVAALIDRTDQARVDVNSAATRAKRAGASIAVAVFLGLAALGALSWWLQVRTRRTINAGVAAGAALLIVAAVTASSSLSNANKTANDAVRSPLTSADLTAQSRTAIFEARSAESLTLIQRGSGQAQEARFQEAFSRGQVAVDGICRNDECTAQAAVDQYGQRHVEVRNLDNSGRWDDAVDLALDATADSGSASAFNRFDVVTSGQLDVAASLTSSQLDNSSDALRPTRWVLAGGFLAAAIAAFIGINRRLAEYR